MGRSISALTKESYSLFGNAVLCQRDVMLAPLPSSVSKQDILELRGSSFSGPFLFDVEVIDRVHQRLKEDLQVQSGILALEASASSGRSSASVSSSRPTEPRRESRPFHGGGGGRSSSYRGRPAGKSSSAGGCGSPASRLH